jgi:hypothetical protein
MGFLEGDSFSPIELLQVLLEGEVEGSIVSDPERDG